MLTHQPAGTDYYLTRHGTDQVPLVEVALEAANLPIVSFLRKRPLALATGKGRASLDEADLRNRHRLGLENGTSHVFSMLLLDVELYQGGGIQVEDTRATSRRSVIDLFALGQHRLR